MHHGSGLLLPGIPFPIGVRKTPLVVGGLSFTIVGTPTTGIDASIELPGTPAAGNLSVIFNAAQQASGDPGSVTPSGYTILHNQYGFNIRMLIAAKKLVGGETTVTGMNGDVRENWICAEFSPDSPFTSFAAAGGVDSLTSGNPASVNLVASGITPPVLLFGHMFGGGNAVDPRSVSPAMTEIAGAGTGHYAHYLAYNPGSTPLDHSYDMDDEGATNGVLGCRITFTV